MFRFGFLVLSLFVLSTGSTMSNTGGGSQTDPIRDSMSVAQEKGVQFAQVGRCRDFGKQQNCRATWDNRDKTCKCAGR
jgi:hypothetical protein